MSNIPEEGSSNAQSVEMPPHDEETTKKPKKGAETSMRPPDSRTSSLQGDVESVKRRSLLPQPGHSRYSSRSDAAAPKSDSTNALQPAPGRLRPRSMYQTATAHSAPDKNDGQAGTSRPIRPLGATSKISEPQMANLGPSRSLRKPNVSTQPAKSKPNAIHTRTQSSSAAGLRKEVANAESSIARPRLLLVPPGGNVKPNSASADSVPVAARTSDRLAGLSRTTGLKPRPETSSSSVATQPAPRPDDALEPQPRRREASKEEPTKTNRPAFSTLQQHFTPRKTGKAPTSTFLHPAPAPAGTSLPPEITSLQSELLQLHLLHATSAEVCQHWHSSARRTLRKKFEKVAALHQAMLEYERAGQEQKNLQALLEWSGSTSSPRLIEYIQILSGPLHELPSLLEPGGRSERLVHEFERWMLRVEQLWSGRVISTADNGNLESVEGLGDSWKAENAALIRKLNSFARDLDQVQQPSSGSSIACIVDTCKTLLAGLSAELHEMQGIEAEVVAREKQWVEARLQAIARDVGSVSVETNEEVAAWRR
ncbi:hypothetical protein BDU57DRAFT_480261 [Ampelomyces quisqualis]|uniref:Uncharacterized protein n=1 Tax=Ampelomyces quisqualis TaxID=50730 RepID=A0A6A5QDQ6_AMPQU|nr:hypothetical protein BDU57DRAFT_480261 [Ampelomyces quisqualis]